MKENHYDPTANRRGAAVGAAAHQASVAVEPKPRLVRTSMSSATHAVEIRIGDTPGYGFGKSFKEAWATAIGDARRRRAMRRSK